MTRLVKILVAIVFIGCAWPLVSQMFDFFDIKQQTYGSYLAWFSALLLFSVLIPAHKENIFSPKIQI